MPSSSSSYRPFAISVTRDGDGTMIVAVGELDLVSADRLAAAMRDVWAGASERVVLDLRQIDFIDSTGLRVLLTLRNDAQRHQREMTLIAPPPAVSRIFDITGTRGLFAWRSDRPLA